MPTLRAIFLLLLCGGATAWGATNAAPQQWVIETGDEGSIIWNLASGEVSYTNGVSISYGDARLAARQVRLNRETGEVAAEGNVTLELTNRIWRGDRVLYNFKTGEINGGDFRTGQAPLFASGEGFAGSRTRW
jgi:lipopolysaccharide assembly outer membrane protein LptD (OstA)